MKIKSGDMVKVISGKSKGFVSKVVSINVLSQRVILENGAMAKRHLKPEKSQKRPEGGIIEIPSSIHVSNVMLMSESDGRPFRAGFELKDGAKVRVARGRSGSGKNL